MLAAPVVLVVGLLVVPTVYTIWVSFYSWSMISGAEPSFIGLGNYIDVLSDASLRGSVGRTMIFVVASVGLQFVVGFGLALLLYHSFGRLKAVQTVLLLPMMVSDVVVGLSWRLILQYDGLANWTLQLAGIPPVYWLGEDLALASIILVDCWQNVPFVTLIIYAALQSLPEDVMDASRVDGASWWARLIHIVIPMIKPAILVVLLFRTVFSLRSFGTVWVLTQGGPGDASTLISIETYRQAFRDFNLGLGSTMSVFLLLIGLIITFAYMRWLNREAL